MLNEKSPIKICYLSFREALDTNLEQLTQCVAKAGYDVTIVNFSSRPKKPMRLKDGRTFCYLNLQKIVHSPGPLQFRLKKAIYLKKAIRFLRKDKYHIIHLDMGVPGIGLLKLLFPGSKFVYHIQSYPVSLKKIRTDVFKTLLTVFLQSFLMNTVIIQSEEQKQRWIGTGRLRRTKIVPIGFNSKVFHPLDETERNALRLKKGIDADTPVLVYAGAMTRQRQLNRLLLALKNVCRKFPAAKVLMIGNGTDTLRLKEIALSLNLQQNIIFTGRVPYGEMVEYYGLADIGLSYIPINNNYNYNPPLKTFEYLACGLPCVATCTVSNSKIIKNEYNGILVSDKINNVSDAVIKLLKDKELAATLRKNARKSVADNDFEILAKKYLLPIYESIL